MGVMPLGHPRVAVPQLGGDGVLHAMATRWRKRDADVEGGGWVASLGRKQRQGRCWRELAGLGIIAREDRIGAGESGGAADARDGMAARATPRLRRPQSKQHMRDCWPFCWP